MMKSCCSEDGLNKGSWSALEDKLLVSYIKTHGEGKWRSLPKKAGLKRCGKSCRLRWLNYLRPGIKRGNITHDEEELIIRLHKLLGNRWSLIAGRLPGRTDNEIKNYWNTTLAKKINAGSAKPPTKRRPMCQSKKKNAGIGMPPSTNLQTDAVRTKALRCTKTPELPLDCSNNLATDHVEVKNSMEMYIHLENLVGDPANQCLVDFYVNTDAEENMCTRSNPPNTSIFHAFGNEIFVENGLIVGENSKGISQQLFDHPISFKEEVMLDSLMRNGGVSPNIDSAQVESLSSFLDLEQEWP